MIIGISGKKQHGKDTIASIIQKITSDFYQNRKFADTLKDMVCVLLKCTRRELEDPEFKEKTLPEEWWVVKETTGLTPYSGFYEKDRIPDSAIIKLTPRKILQLLGTECGREIIHPNLWVISTMIQYNDNQNWIITDVRFPNEVAAIKNRGGVLIRVERPDVGGDDYHPSETSLDDYQDWDYKIVNDGNLIDLKNKTTEACYELGLI